MKDDEIVGHKTFSDGRGGFYHEPLTRAEAKALVEAVEASKRDRIERMPDEKSAIRHLFDAYLRLTELGWQGINYCPKDGSQFNVLELGSTGIHSCCYEGEWPNGRYWIYTDGDIWPSNPILFKSLSPT